MKAVLYCRVSTREQEETGYSLEAQEKLLREYGIGKFEIAKVFRISESASGKQIRKTFTEMLEYITKNKINIIVCEKIDRLTRNLKDAALISDWITEDETREVHFVKESFIVNKNTRAHENLVWDMKVAIARFYTNNLSEEIKKGQKEKIAQGWIPKTAPLGYKTIGEKSHKIHVVDPDKAPYIVKMFELYATGNYSLKALADLMYEDGLRNTHGNKVLKSRMHELLRDPFYCGKIRWINKIYEGKHESLIPIDLFEEVNNKLLRKLAVPQYRKHLSLFKGKIFCAECGGTITWYMKKGHYYGNCSHFKDCHQKGCLRQEKAEEQLMTYFDNVSPRSEKALQWLNGSLKDEHETETNEIKRKRIELSGLLTRAERRIEEAYKDKLDKKIPADICEKIIADTTKDKENLSYALKKLEESDQPYYEAGYLLHDLALNARAIYTSPEATMEDKRLLLSLVFSNLIMYNKKLAGFYTPAFEFMAAWSPKLKINLRTFSEQTKNPAISEVSCDSALVESEKSLSDTQIKNFNLRTEDSPYFKPQIDWTTYDLRLLR